MIGAACGDIIGSKYEAHNIKSKHFEFFDEGCRFTDDTVMTCAIAQAVSLYFIHQNYDTFKEDCIKYLKLYGRTFINAGYGGRFLRWIISADNEPYYSYGNGSAMRVSPVAYAAKSLAEAEKLAEITASVTHNHPDGIAGAKAVAGSIWILLNKGSKEDVYNYVSKFYNLDFKIDEIRATYEFDVSCKGSVPEAIKAFLESAGFEDTIRNAISIGGDSDTIGAIAGSLAEAYYGVPEDIKSKALEYLDPILKESLQGVYYNRDSKRDKGNILKN